MALSSLLGVGLQDILIVCCDCDHFKPKRPKYEYHWGHRFPVRDGRAVINKNSHRAKRLSRKSERQKEESEKKKALLLQAMIGKNEDEVEEQEENN